MPTQVLLPKVDNDMTEGRISRWFVKDEQRVAKGDPLFEIETDKAAMEVEAPAAGTIGGIVGAAGGSAPVGSPVAWIYADGEDRGAMPTAPSEPVPSPTSAAPQAKPRPEVEPAKPRTAAKLVAATPLARRLARERGIDLGLLNGTGPRGRIQRSDVAEARADAAAIAAVASPRAQANLHREWLRAGDGDPVVLVHGFGSELAIWRPLVSGLDLARPLLAVDLPGHGGSAAAGIDGFDQMVDLVEEALGAEGIRRAHLVGHSLGGAAVAALAERSAIETRSLLLISPAGLGPDINGAFLSGFCRARSEESLTPWMRLLVTDPSQIGPAFVRATLRARSAPGATEALERMAGRLFPDGTQSFSIRGALGRLSVPVRIVVGAEDWIIPAAHARGLSGRIAIHHFAGVGHMPHLEIRPEVGQILTATVRAAASP